MFAAQKVETHSLAETQQLAKAFAKNFAHKGGLILLSGNLGAGKTSFTQSFIKSFGITQHIISPTFLLIKQYQIPDTERLIFHLDLYRLTEPINLQETGITEILASINENIVLIEWSEKIIDQLTKPYFQVNLKSTAEDKREITITQST